MELGKKIEASEKTEIEVFERAVRGPTWSVQKKGDTYIFEYFSGQLSGALKQHEVTEADFAQIRNGEITENDLMIKYDLS